MDPPNEPAKPSYLYTSLSSSGFAGLGTPIHSSDDGSPRVTPRTSDALNLNLVRSSADIVITAPPKPPPPPPKPPQAAELKLSPILLLSEVSNAPESAPAVMPVGPSPFASPVLANIASSGLETTRSKYTRYGKYHRYSFYITDAMDSPSADRHRQDLNALQPRRPLSSTLPDIHTGVSPPSTPTQIRTSIGSGRLPTLPVPLSIALGSPKVKPPPSPAIAIPVPSGRDSTGSTIGLTAAGSTPTPGYSPLARSATGDLTPSPGRTAPQTLPTSSSSFGVILPRPFPIVVSSSSAPVCVGVSERALESSYTHDQTDLDGLEYDIEVASAVGEKRLSTHEQLLVELVQGLNQLQLNHLLHILDHLKDHPAELANIRDRVAQQVPFTQPTAVRDWNAEFQVLLTSSGPDKFRLLANLSHDFVNIARTYGELIISECCLPLQDKTIKPASVGGIAGGDKYVCQGILFKFCRDIPIAQEKGEELWMYGGMHQSWQNAMKSAGHELKGLTSYHNAKVDGLRVPLMALIDYRGIRLLAVSILPITKDTLRYGSHDGGFNVRASDPELNRRMEEAGRRINLKKHIVVSTEMWGPGDIEGHKGLDGQYYVIDFGRVMPPSYDFEMEKDRNSRRIFYEKLRPEFVRAHTVPLSSDALCRFGHHDRHVHNPEVKAASTRLLQTVIPEFAKNLDATASNEMTIANIVTQMHQAGINVRFMGRIRSNILRPDLRRTLLIDMVARLLKTLLNAALRKKMEEVRLSLEEPYKTVVANFFNRLTQESEVSANYWNKELKFPHCLSAQESAPMFKLQRAVNMWQLLHRVAHMCGIKLSTGSLAVLQKAPGSSSFVQSDIIMSPKVKYLSVIEFCEAMALRQEAQRKWREESDPTGSDRLFDLANEKFLAAEALSPDSFEAFYQHAGLYSEHSKRKVGHEADTLCSKAFKNYDIAIHIKHNYHEALAEYFDRLWEQGSRNLALRQSTRQLFDRAGEVLEAALAARPDIYEEATRKLISRAVKGKDSMQSLLECALKSPHITRLIAQEAGRIRTLDFRSCQQLVDAPLLNILGACSQLERFYVSYAPTLDNSKQVTDESVLALSRHCPVLQEVVLQNAVNLTDNAVNAVLAACAKTLVNLSLKGVPDLTDAILPNLRACKSIKKLALDRRLRISREAMKDLGEQLPGAAINHW